MTSKELVITAGIIAVIVVACLIVNVVNGSGDRETADGMSAVMMGLVIVATLAVLGFFVVGFFVQLNRNSPTVTEWITGGGGPRARSRAAPLSMAARAFPVQPLEQDPAAAATAPSLLRFKVLGVDRKSRRDITWYCAAESDANARAKGELEGILVTRVERVA